MTYPDDSLDPLFIPKNQFSAPSFRTGVLEEWNPDTFANAVNVDGAVLHDLPVMNGIEALSFTTGIPVSLLGQSGTGVLTAYAILGRYIQPGTSATAQAIQALQTTLVTELLDELVTELLTSPAGQELAAFVIGQRVHTASATAIVSTTSSSFVSLSGGPVLNDVIVSDAAKLLVLVGSNMQVTSDHTGGMSFEISGDSTILPNDSWGQVVSYQDPDVGGVGVRAVAGAVFTATDGINPGTHTIEAKYHRLLGLTSNIQFSNRVLVAIGF